MLAAIVVMTLGAGMAPIPGGELRPLLRADAPTQVSPFWIDVAPVTNAEFLRFVASNPKWRRGAVPRVFAEPDYLRHWTADLDPGAPAADAPVVFVSWFAAKRYCEARGARLPTLAEWELVAQASADAPDARDDAATRRRILDWYAEPATVALRAVKGGPPNYFGVHDLHGLVWEWVLDFSSELVSADNRVRGDPDSGRFCGSGALDAADPEDYATLMRMAYRSSLEAAYTTARQGFRCANTEENP
jgi:formylglycine-generating enzyme